MMPTHSYPVLVIGATGRIGRRVVDELVRAGAPVRALTRRPAQAALPPGVEVVTGDLAVPESLDSALQDVGSVFIVWAAAPTTAPAVCARLAADRSPPSRRVVYLSAPFRTPHPFFQQPNPMRALHADVETALEATGLDIAILRPGMFASNALHWWAPQIRAGDVVRWPYATAETAPLDEKDLAAVAARVLLDARYARTDVVLTGPESLSQAAQVEAIGTAIARPLRFEEMSPDEFRRATMEAWPEGIADMLLGAWRATLGRSAFVTAGVHEILGTSPSSFSEWAARHAAAFTSARSA